MQDTMRRPNLRIIGIDENEDFQLKGPANILNKIIEENFPNIKNNGKHQSLIVVSGQQTTTWVLAWKGILETWKRRGARWRDKEM